MSTRRRRVRSIALRVLVFLLLGAVVNVGVAWAIAFCADVTGGQFQSNVNILQPLKVAQGAFRFPGSMNTGQMHGYHYSSLHMEHVLLSGILRTIENGSLRRSLSDSATDDATLVMDDLVFVRCGFPVMCVSGVAHQSVEAMFTSRSQFDVGLVANAGVETETHGAFIVDVRGEYGPEAILMPVRPIWPGFAINTFLYAAILWLLFAAPGSVRRWRRIRRGVCAKCAYPIGASDVCTECGAAVATCRRPARE
jgi:hypothetical protein